MVAAVAKDEVSSMAINLDFSVALVVPADHFTASSTGVDAGEADKQEVFLGLEVVLYEACKVSMNNFEVSVFDHGLLLSSRGDDECIDDIEMDSKQLVVAAVAKDEVSSIAINLDFSVALVVSVFGPTNGSTVACEGVGKHSAMAAMEVMLVKPSIHYFTVFVLDYAELLNSSWDDDEYNDDSQVDIGEDSKEMVLAKGAVSDIMKPICCLSINPLSCISFELVKSSTSFSSVLSFLFMFIAVAMLRQEAIKHFFVVQSFAEQCGQMAAGKLSQALQISVLLALRWRREAVKIAFVVRSSNEGWVRLVVARIAFRELHVAVSVAPMAARNASRGIENGERRKTFQRRSWEPVGPPPCLPAAVPLPARYCT